MQIASLVFLSALGLGWESMRRIGSPQPAQPLWTLALAGANAVIKEALYQYKIRVSRRTGSSVIRANAWDHRADALCSLAVMGGLALIRIGGEQWRDADEGAALFVVVAILASSGRLFLESVRELMDLQADDWLVERVRAEALLEKGVRGVEKLWLRKAGLEYFAELHLEVDPNATVLESHRLGHRVKDRLLAAFPAVRDVLVHLEPDQ
jgi:cation diffusion facilitator family transporter